MSQQLPGLLKTHQCGELREEHIGQTVTLCGWVNKYRDLGGLHFIDMRDKTGITQLGFEEYSGDLSILKDFSLESVVLARGVVKARPEAAKNANMLTGQIEVQVQELKLLAQAETPPFLPHSKANTATEDLRLKYRYLDLRSQKLQDILKLRSNTARKVREALYSLDFTEVETPILYKTTPEGARDYIVPSRVHPGKVYALPQSPQTLKQLLMIANTDRYFQICKCFRDEDLRADRQPEFTQIDIEVSFTSLEYMKNLATYVVRNAFDLPENFEVPSMPYQEALARYGSDKPDTRFGLEHLIVTDIFTESDFKVFQSVSQSNGLIKAIFIPESLGNLARKDVDALTEVVKPFGGKGVAWFKNTSEGISGGISKFIKEEYLKSLQSLASTQESGLWLFFADSKHQVAHDCADAVRRHLGRKLNLIDPDAREFLWVHDFPLLEYDAENKRHVALHHPFTMPHEDDLESFMDSSQQDLTHIRAQAYDLVCNGHEIAGGSMRIYNSAVQSRMFKVLGFTEEDATRQFGFFIEALRYGTPPHGGIAFGMDRVIMILAKTDSIRDVIAFPKTATATDLMASSPSVPNSEQLNELGVTFPKI
jgi:aspartyl-tRNA synthetase